EARRVLSENEALYAFLNRLRKRFYPLTNYSLLVLLVTGMFQMPPDPNYQGLLDFSNDWGRLILLKHVGVVGMVICGLAIQYSVIPALERTSMLLERGKGDPAEYERLRRREVRLTWANIVLALLVLACTAWATSL
ncbi:MAG TPA: CopD family protein, partial [Oceanobacillus sp.]|nr:CopD family protein [Oceanobacillus sp.]